jgi:UDP-N-acetylmuramoyl-L-alanyl-D-glutamate--2,6-diaminopimelate ligase
MEQYAAAKQKLFTTLADSKAKKVHAFPKRAIVNGDSPWHLQMLADCRAEILSYGMASNVDLRACDLTISLSGTQFKLQFQGHEVTCHTPLIGVHNVYNYMASAAVGLVRGISLADIAACLAAAPLVPGRLEAVPNDLGVKIVVDFAHTPDALKNVLESLQAVKKERIITIFGCGGDRDKSKRSKMAEVSEALSDLSIVTSDNPRSEDPEQICREILRGFQKPDCYLVELDRKQAIKKGISLAGPGDILLIAGKGHELYQIFAHHRISFDDRQVAAELCKQR